ncbi:hypothetical protein MTR_8g014677 [Medicago truncatula]|uniref:Uncharacterized protein n=1 Tax=Medicago truncatula TaxID=3880 RepID=A0A072TLC0_MEDTR|nr:hypothetical protein MTR_8g014677 [Medicago truncatula]
MSCNFNDPGHEHQYVNTMMQKQSPQSSPSSNGAQHQIASMKTFHKHLRINAKNDDSEPKSTILQNLLVA